MEKTNLICPIAYAALLYCWGDATISANIYVNGVKTQVTNNLADALATLAEAWHQQSMGGCSVYQSSRQTREVPAHSKHETHLLES
jgi:Heterokaryon incompatibility protein (HET)